MVERAASEQKQDLEKKSSSKRWYVLRAETGYEKYVQRALQRHIEIHHLHTHFGKIMVPSEEVVEVRLGQKKTHAT